MKGWGATVRNPLPRKLEIPAEWPEAHELVQDTIRDILEHLRTQPRVELLEASIRGGSTLDLRLSGRELPPSAVLMVKAHRLSRPHQTARPTAALHWVWNPGDGDRAGSVRVTAPSELTSGVDYHAVFLVVDLDGAA